MAFVRIPHARVRRVTTQWWTLEISIHAGETDMAEPTMTGMTLRPE
jgi:hypothetical protein